MKSERVISRKILCMTLLSSLAFAFAAKAQEQNQESDSEESAEQRVELIEVRGYRDSLRKSIAIKRESDTIVDAVSAEDVGQFPDVNVADALQRVTGVQVEKDERDGEGARVSIRGTASHLNLAFLNNQQIATASASNRLTELRDRSFNYYLLPTEILDTLEVYKSPEANVDEGSVGGTVIVRTRRPLDADANTGAFSARYFHFDNAGENKPYVSGLYSWKNDAETFGFNVAYVNRDSVTLMDSKRNLAGYFNPTDYNGDGLLERSPAQIGANRYTAEYSLDTPFVTLQFAPRDDLNIVFTALNSKTKRYSQGIYSYGFALPAVRAPRIAEIVENNLATVRDGTVVAGNYPVDPLGAKYDTGSYRDEVETTAVDFEGTLERGSYRVTIQAGHSFADGLAIDKNADFTAASTTQFDLTAGLLEGSIDPNLTPEDYSFGYSHLNTIRNDSDSTFFQADTEITLNNDFFSSIEAGIKYREYNKGASRIKRDFQEEGTLSRFVGDPITEFGVGAVPVNMWTFNDDALTEWQNSVPELAGTANVSWDDPNSRYRVSEDVTAAYIKGNFETENFRGNMGLRAVRTKTSAKAQQYGGDDRVVRVRVWNADRLGAAQEVEANSDYTDILPSLNVNYVGFDDVVLRFAAATVFARPNYVSIAPYETRYCGSRGCVGFGGNPDLEPYRSNQYDISAEWYIDEASILSFAVFYKDIESYIDLESFEEIQDFRGIDDDTGEYFVEPRLFTIERPINGEGISIQGFELNYKQDLAYGFGVKANYTYADASLNQTEAQREAGQEPFLFGHSEQTWNATAYYQRRGLAARLSYTFRSEYPSSFLRGIYVLTSSQEASTASSNAYVGLGRGTSRGLIGYKGDFGQFDFNASYHLTNDIQVLFQIINLGDEEIVWYASKENHPPDPGRPIGTSNHGRRFAIGMNVKF